MPDSCGCQVSALSCVCQGMDELCQAVLVHGGCLTGCTQSPGGSPAVVLCLQHGGDGQERTRLCAWLPALR